MKQNAYRSSIITRMIALANTAERIADQGLFSHFDLSATTGGVLLMVSKFPETTPTDIMKRFGCTRSNVTQRLDKLETMSLLKRVANRGSDKRSISLALTPKGKKTAEILWEKVQNRATQAESIMKPAEVERLHEMFDRIEVFLKQSEHRAW
ncbi:MAG: MarR family transcriptional regulator [Patescibacteria group bacterium]